LIAIKKPMQTKKDNQEKQATSGTQDNNNGQSRETGNIGHTRHQQWTIKRNWLVCPMLPVSLDCPLLMSCVPDVASFS
jgi:hypothetical protein